MKNGKKNVRVMLIAILAVVVCGGGYFAYNKYTENKRAARMAQFLSNEVPVEIAERSNIQEMVSATGVVYLKDEQSVYATGEAKVREVLVEVGDHVSESQELVRYEVNDTSYNLDQKIKEAEISLQNQKLSLQSLGLGPTESELDQLKSNIESAEKSLLDANVSYQNTLDKINQYDTDIASAARDIEKADIDIEKADRDIEKANRDLDNANHEVDNANHQLENANHELENANYEVENANHEVKNANHKLEDANHGLENAIYELNTAQKNLEDHGKLLAVGAITQEEYDKVADTVRIAENTVRNAENTVRDAENAIRNTGNTIRNAENTIRNAENTIRNAENTIRNAKNGIQTANDAIKSAENSKQTALYAKQSVVEKYNSLVASKEMSDAELSRQLEINAKSVENAQSALNLARKKYNQAGVKTEDDNINYQKQANQVQLSELSLRDLQKQKSEITYSTNSPLSGTITSVHVERGSAVDTDTVLLAVADFTQLIVKANISEYDAPLIELGQKVTMVSDGIPGSTYNGEIITISGVAEGQSSVSGNETVVPIEISVENADELLKPGFNLDVEILAVDKQDVVNVSISAIQRDKETGEQYVFIVGEDRKLKKTVIETDTTNDLNIEIISGIEEGARVITNPDNSMQDGADLDSLNTNPGGRNVGGAENGNGQNGNRNRGPNQTIPSGGGGGGGPQGRVIIGG